MTQVERQARSVIAEVYPDRPRQREPEEPCPTPPASAVVLPASRSGYLQAMLDYAGPPH